MKRSHFVLAALAGILLGAAILSQPSAAQTAPRQIEVTARRFAFEPAEITIKKGEPVVLMLKSGDVANGIRCRELNIDLKVNKGGTTEAHFTPDKVGNFVAHCAVFCGSGHGQMAITIHVVE